MKYLLALLLASSASAGGIVQGGMSSGASSINAPCTTVSCILGPLYIDGTTPSVTVTSSATVRTASGDVGVYLDQGYLKINSNNSVNRSIAFADGTPVTGADRFWMGSDTTGLFINDRTGAGAEIFRWKNGGNVGIGTASPATKLHLSSGTITIDGTGSPTTGGALCLNASGAMSKCTTVVDVSGNCTCP